VGRRGPKPLPAALLVLRGSNRAVTVRNPPAVGPGEAPRMPKGLSPDERACWRGLMRELGTVPGLLARADRGVCELLSRLEPMLRASAVIVREQGSTLQCLDAEGRLKFVQTRPEATFVLKAGALVKGLYGELGLSPSGRCRVSLTPAAPASKLDRFLQEKHGA
jgi:phage terminase small subunit